MPSYSDIQFLSQFMLPTAMFYSDTDKCYVHETAQFVYMSTADSDTLGLTATDSLKNEPSPWMSASLSCTGMHEAGTRPPRRTAS